MFRLPCGSVLLVMSRLTVLTPISALLCSLSVGGLQTTGSDVLPQGVTLALARSPRRVSKVSGERKSSITRPFGEYNFNCQEII